MGGVNQEFSGRLAESPLTQQSQGRVHHRSSHVFRTSCASGKLLLLPPDKGFGMWVSFGAHGCVLLGTEGSGGNQERSQPGWSCSLRGGTCGLPELFLTSLYIWLCHNQGMKPSRGVPHAPIPFAMPESFPSQNRVTCPVQADQDMTLMLNLAAKGRSGLLSSAKQDLRPCQPHLWAFPCASHCP